MHKSKGLEYPLVFIPFPWSVFKPPPGPKPPPFFHADEDRTACLDLGSGNQADHRELERIEQLAERLRLLYVAITRAAKLCVLCWGKVNGAEASAPAYLLHQAIDGDTPDSRMKGLAEEEIRGDLETFAAKQPDGIAVCDLPLVTGASWQPGELDREQLRARRFTAEGNRRWCVSSYSALVRGGEAEHPDHDPPDADAPTADEVTTEERNSAASDASGEPAEPGEPIVASGSEHDADQEPLSKLPAGPHVGQFLHEMFENLDFLAASGEGLKTTVRSLLARHGGL